MAQWLSTLAQWLGEAICLLGCGVLLVVMLINNIGVI